MAKANDRGMTIDSISLIEKKGGQSGHWQRYNETSGHWENE
jgi:molybdenum cofactor biosynthesis enzyme